MCLPVRLPPVCPPRIASVLLALMLTSAVAFGAPAKPKADQAKKYFEAAVRLYNAFEFERSLEQLQKARATAVGPELDVSIALYEGILQLELGREAEAETSFKSALALDSKATLPARVSPKAQQLFERLKPEVWRPLPTPPAPKEELKPAPSLPPGPLPAGPPQVEQRASRGPPVWWWAPAAGGAAAAVAGSVLLFQAKGRSDSLAGRTMADFDLATAERYRSEGSTFQTVGFAAIGLGIACVAVSAVVFLLMRGS